MFSNRLLWIALFAGFSASLVKADNSFSGLAYFSLPQIWEDHEHLFFGAEERTYDIQKLGKLRGIVANGKVKLSTESSKGPWKSTFEVSTDIPYLRFYGGGVGYERGFGTLDIRLNQQNVTIPTEISRDYICDVSTQVGETAWAQLGTIQFSYDVNKYFAPFVEKVFSHPNPMIHGFVRVGCGTVTSESFAIGCILRNNSSTKKISEVYFSHTVKEFSLSVSNPPEYTESQFKLSCRAR